MFRAEGVDDLMLDHFKIEAPAPDWRDWEAMVRRAAERARDRADRAGRQVRASSPTPTCRSSRRCGTPASTTARRSTSSGSTPRRSTRARAPQLLEEADGILIPGGFGVRGIEGKINAARVARERGIPFLGICLGMQLAVVDFARHVVGMDGANSAEFDPETPYPVVDLLPEQKEVDDMGGTMRLGADPVKLHAGHARARASTTSP